ncbi:6-phosphogluconate dehydrogenase [Biscogniauxia sp. FL1348]|nr:6-phosphogluconate dehydrogenase [Biscogniauxia sp. FL1348]
MPGLKIKKVGMLGVGSMGAMLTLLMAERGYEVYFFDPNEKNMTTLTQQSRSIQLSTRVHPSPSYAAVCASLPPPRVLLLSTPHGSAADACVAAVGPRLSAGDVVIDCGNEHWAATERRQQQALFSGAGARLVGCGVSGGYQSARAGPSMAPGGDAGALDAVMPFLRTLAARDGRGRPCVARVGPGGSGHYVKMVHNGIEQGMMGAAAEAWLLLTRGLGLGHDEVGRVLRRWNDDASSPLRDCFLIAIGADVERARDDDDDDSGEHVVSEVRDTVVQDVDEEEGTGVWACEEAIARHVPAASIVSAHLFRCASADLARRQRNRQSASGGVRGRALSIGPEEREQFIEALRAATYFCFLACFAQGLDLIRQKDKDRGWGLDYGEMLQLWRGGCIIQAEHIADVLERLFSRPDHDPDDILSNPEVGHELARCFPAAKQVVLRAVEADLFVPVLSQTLEYYKYETSTELPTQFMEAQLDYFGQHMFERKDDPVRGPHKGHHHYEWKPAKGASDE